MQGRVWVDGIGKKAFGFLWEIMLRKFQSLSIMILRARAPLCKHLGSLFCGGDTVQQAALP